MNQECGIRIDRSAGAEAISARAKEIGKEMGVIISECIWDLGKDFKLQHAHRLDLSTATKTVRLYFPDLELTTSGNDARKERTEDRLQRAIAQLLPNSPSSTYATSA
jgi:hypothetical protein